MIVEGTATASEASKNIVEITNRSDGRHSTEMLSCFKKKFEPGSDDSHSSFASYVKKRKDVMQKILLCNKESPASVPLSISVSTASDVTACSAENCTSANQKLFDTFVRSVYKLNETITSVNRRIALEIAGIEKLHSSVKKLNKTSKILKFSKKALGKNQDHGKDSQTLKYAQQELSYASESASEFMSSYWRNLSRLSSNKSRDETSASEFRSPDLWNLSRQSPDMSRDLLSASEFMSPDLWNLSRQSPDMSRDLLSASEFMSPDLMNLPRQLSDMLRDQMSASDMSSALKNLSRQASGMSRDQMCDTENHSESEILTKLKFAVEKIERQNEILNSDGSVLEKKVKKITSTTSELYSLEDCENHLVQIEDLYSDMEIILKDTEELLSTYNEYNEMSFLEDPDFVENNSLLHESFQVSKLRLGLTYMHFSEKFAQFMSHKNELELLRSVFKESLS
ncbi:hypothetical protein CDAR_264681 [Caerostris darwini]|uniref:Uncharacterized protein n=1 Tax=Caerostris darwini TaxID=1538125 RepID=A0AAV4NQA3_9ARAC|nr:hypothetical protein CDAR_264681 [Caerostris darwini]